MRPSCLVCGDDDALPAVQQLVGDAGFDAVVVGGLQYAVDLEDFLLNVIFPVAQSRQSPFFYRIAGPGEL